MKRFANGVALCVGVLTGFSASAVAARTITPEDVSLSQMNGLALLERGAGLRAAGERARIVHREMRGEAERIAGEAFETLEHLVGESRETPGRVLSELSEALEDPVCDGPRCHTPEHDEDEGELSEIDPVPAPLPAGIALMGTAFLGLGLVSLRRRRG